MSNRLISTRISVGLIFFGLTIASSSSQEPATGQISGHVTDPMGAEIPNARVFVRDYYTADDAIKVVGHADSHGNFVLILPEGGYDILVTSMGFASGVETVGVFSGKTTKVEWKLKILGCDFPRVICDDFGPAIPLSIPIIDVTPQTLIN